MILNKCLVSFFMVSSIVIALCFILKGFPGEANIKYELIGLLLLKEVAYLNC